MVGFLLRLSGTALLAAGLVAMFADASRSFSNAHLVLTSTQQLIAGVVASDPAPDSSPGVMGLIGPLSSAVRIIPACLSLGGVGALCLLLGRPRQKGIGYVGR